MTREERQLLQNALQRLQQPLLQLVKQAPTFPGDKELADALGYAYADLECKIREL